MAINRQAAKQSSFLVTAEFVLTNKQVVIGLLSLGNHSNLADYIKAADTFITVPDRKKKNPDTVIRTDQIVTIRELNRKEISSNKLDL
ncbi:MAG: hypothetical protein HQL70_04510 [Magnetococcales bacterium]|nr:hypothetical protein [Magnetococcales bacterium]